MAHLFVSEGRCQFCHRTAIDVEQLIAGDSGGMASRPGRIDQTIEFPLPDQTLRRHLIGLYSRTLPVPSELMDALARRTDGASPAFIKEFLRRIAQHHLDSGSPGVVSAATADAALHEMVFSGGTLNSRLLGGAALSDSLF